MSYLRNNGVRDLKCTAAAPAVGGLHHPGLGLGQAGVR